MLLDIIPIILIIGISLFLKLFHVRYKRLLKEYNEIQKNKSEAVSLLSSEISYSKYKEISQRASVPNRPIRESGDFFDFLISYATNDTHASENNLKDIEL